ncbi:MAG: iron ABC transporter [Leptolyngbya sp. PLA1]|nr:iron ABC transporter [Leptolyngbya sp. PLA1]
MTPPHSQPGIDSAWAVLSLGFGATEAWTLATAVLCAVGCGVVGCFLVLRRLSLLGDAISHSVLPGLAAAFIITQSRGTIPMLAGALVVGLLTGFLSAGLSRWGRVSEDSSLGVVFSSLFALGVLMITWVARDVDLDPGCVLYGLIEFVPFDRIGIAGLEVPRAMVGIGVMLLVSVTLIVVFFKELRITAFDPSLATTMGISAAVMHYGLMGVVAATTVVSFEAVGSILVVAMLVAPGAAAQLMTDRLHRMLWLAAGVAALAAVLGYGAALALNTSIAGMIATASLAMYVLAALLAPAHGWLPRLVRRYALSLRIAREDLLGLLYRRYEKGQAAGTEAEPLAEAAAMRALGGGMLSRLATWGLRREGLAEVRGGGLVATSAGLSRARGVIRSHRLWESYLARNLPLPADHLHEPAHRAEHFLTPEAVEALSEMTPESVDPHGKSIPPASRGE